MQSAAEVISREIQQTQADLLRKNNQLVFYSISALILIRASLYNDRHGDPKVTMLLLLFEGLAIAKIISLRREIARLQESIPILQSLNNPPLPNPEDPEAPLLAIPHE